MARRRVTGSYILFESRFARDLFCAVPKSCPIPDFLVGASWKFKGTLDENRKKPAGFKEEAVPGAVQREGCYFFVRSGRALKPPYRGSPQPDGQ